ncbi:hypothetical protein [Aquabacterium sp.]|uniref:hypothetical protein n=1 Tax=Aquabacterium sp. TaxID=1872578 RepID=UPI0025BDCC73|nr:hypothetical protein [Aquabacterium sp.]
MKVVLFILARLREPSTLAGLGLLAGLLGLNPEHIDPVTQAIGATAGAVAVFLPEAR